MDTIEQRGSSQAQFDLQYEVNRRTFSFSEGDVTVFNVNPTENHNQIPVLIAPGWSGNSDTYKKSMREIYNAGREGITLEYSRRGGIPTPHETYVSAQFRKARQLRGALNMMGIQQVDGIFHSEGAVVGMMAAMLDVEAGNNPGLFRNIVLDKPAGLIGTDRTTRLTGRFMKLLATEAFQRKPYWPSDPTNSLSTSVRTLEFISRNPLRALEEVKALNIHDLADIMYKLEESGVSIALVSGVKDPLYPTSRQLAHIKEAQASHEGTLPFDLFFPVKGGHNALSINANKHTTLAIEVLRLLEKQRVPKGKTQEA